VIVLAMSVICNDCGMHSYVYNETVTAIGATNNAVVTFIAGTQTP